MLNSAAGVIFPLSTASSIIEISSIFSLRLGYEASRNIQVHQRVDVGKRTLSSTQPITSMDNLIVGDDVRVGFR
jgi:hypothetical protein